MRFLPKNENGINTCRLNRAIPLLLILVLLACSLTTYAWFYYGRRVAAIAEISNPTAIFINAGHAEDIRYLDLGDIDVEGTDTCKDFVFCVRGNNVQYYRLQLAYTTNNQFEYTLYRALVTQTRDSVPANPVSLVVYDLHTTSETYYYYVASGTNPVVGHFLNQDTSVTGETVALPTGTYHNMTYPSPTPGATFDHHQQYAVPLYWQSNDSIHPTLDSNNDFCDYYILRISWTSANRNDKETDIVYIAAKNVAS